MHVGSFVAETAIVAFVWSIPAAGGAAWGLSERALDSAILTCIGAQARREAEPDGFCLRAIVTDLDAVDRTTPMRRAWDMGLGATETPIWSRSGRR